MEFFKTTDIQNKQDINEQIGIKLKKIIFDNINNDLNKIYEYDISPTEDKSTILQIAENHYLLLNKCFMKSFYIYWRQKLLSNTLDLNEIDLVSLCVLLINPNVSTAWSKRKTLYDTSNITKELDLNKLILVKNVKCECAYVHRRWLVKKLPSLDLFLMNELEYFFSNLCFKIKANYYCWSYLNWILFYAIEKCNYIELSKIFAWFFTKLEDYLYLNPSDYCLFHTRLNLIIKLNDQNRLFYLNDFKTLIEHELELIDDLAIRYSHLTTIWHYRKHFILYLINNHKSKIVNLNWQDLNKKFNSYLEENKFENKIMIVSNETVWFKLLIRRELDILNVFKLDHCENSIRFLNKFLIL